MKYTLLIKPKNILKFILVLVLFSGIQSCIKDKFDFNRLAQVEYEPTLAAPVLHTKLTLWDVLYDWDSSHLFVQDQTHFLTLLYRGTIFSQTADQLISIADQNFAVINQSFNNPNPPQHEIEFVVPLSFTAPNGDSLYQVFVKQGTWNLNYNSDLKENATVSIAFPSVTRVSDNAVLTFIDPVATGPQSINHQTNLSGYKILLNHNTITCNIKITFQTGVVTSNNSINISNSITNILYSKLIGYFGQPSFDILKDTVFLDIFKRNLSGRFTLVDPKLNIYVSNSYGFPINISFSKFESYRVNVPIDSLAISGSGFPNPWTIISPTLSQVGQTMVTPLLLDKTTSNIDDAINISPQYVVYHTNALGNPAGYIAGAPNFVLDTSKFKVDVDVELPIWGKAIDFCVQDTFKMEEFKMENRDKIDWAELRVTSTNGFPVDVKLQLIFCDTLYNRIDSLYYDENSQIINSGILGPAPNYRVIMPYIKKTETKMTGERVNYMIDHNVKKVLLRATLNTSNNHGTDVKFYSDYTIDVKVGVKTHIKLKY